MYLLDPNVQGPVSKQAVHLSSSSVLLKMLENISIPVTREEIQEIYGSKFIPTGNERKIPLHIMMNLCVDEYTRQRANQKMKLQLKFRGNNLLFLLSIFFNLLIHICFLKY